MSADEQASSLERLRERLRLFAARRLRNWDDAEDVAQEALRRALDSLRAGKIENPAALPAFLFQTVVHICQHRGTSSVRETKALRHMASGPEPVVESADPLEAMMSSERREAVRQALGRLDSADRQLLDWTYVDALDAAEIGRRLGISPGNVRVRRHRALRRLSEILNVTAEPDRGLNL